MSEVIVVGGGLAGSEAALQLASRGVDVTLYEMRPQKNTPAHHSDGFAELVCSNSLKSLDGASAAGILKYELFMLGSKLIDIAFSSSVPAGKALAVDRSEFSKRVTDAIYSDSHIHVVQEEFKDITSIDVPTIVATGPLTSESMAASIQKVLGTEFMSFYDAAAPIISFDSIDQEQVFAQSRYGKGGADYFNAPFNKEEYESFVTELINAERAIPKEFERKELFSACQPVEEIARTGLDALRFGPLKPVGLTDPNTGHRPWAVVQLRSENEHGSAYNLVGFQTNLKFSEQERVFRMIPALKDVEFLRFGVMHRNTFIDSPHALSAGFISKQNPNLRFAGQITGTEGYCEAIASGLMSALSVYAQLQGIKIPELPRHTMFGALCGYASDINVKDYQPMHVNFGILNSIEPKIKNKQERYCAYARRARQSLKDYIVQLEKLQIIDTDSNRENKIYPLLGEYIVE